MDIPLVPEMQDANSLADNNKLLRYVSFLELDPNNLPLTLEAVQLAINTQNWDMGKTLIIKALPLFPESAPLHAHAGYIQMVLGELPQAILSFNSAIGLGEHSPVIYFNLAQTHLFLSEIKAAHQVLVQHPEVEQQLPQEYLLLSARLNHHLDNPQESIDQLNKLHSTFGITPESAGLLSLILFEEGKDYDQAQKLADDALAKNPKVIEALVARTSLNLHFRKYDQALLDIDQAVQFYPTSGRAWSTLAQVEFNNLHFDIACDAAQKAVEYMPDSIGTWHLLGWSNLMLNKLDAALVAFQKSYDLDRRFAETHGGLAAVYAHLGEIKLANNHVKLAEKLNPGGLAAVYAKIVLLNMSNQQSEANDLFEKSKQIYSENLGSTPQQLIEQRLFELSVAANNQKTVH